MRCCALKFSDGLAGRRLIVVALVGGDDLLHEVVARNVLFREGDETNAVHALQDARRFLSTRKAFPPGRSICVASPVITAFEP